MKAWKLLDRWQIFKNPFMKMRVDRCELPDGRVMPNYFVLDFNDWVTAVALDEHENMIMVRQYRHGIEETLLEAPAGSMDIGGSEDPLESAKRELLEETGYESNEWVSAGSFAPNPALMSNCMHVFVATNCKKVAEQKLDPFEDIDIELHPAKDIYEKAEQGEIVHALCLGALMLARPYVNQRVPLS